MQTIATGTKNQSTRSTPHILGMMELGKITQEIKRIQEGIPYEIIRIFQHSESTSQILDGKSIKRNPAATFDFGKPIIVIKKGEKGEEGDIDFIYTGAMSLTAIKGMVSPRVRELIERTYH